MQFRLSFRQLPWFEIALGLAVMAVHLRAATSDAFNFPTNWFSRDDAYYYFKVAQNIATGQGSTFDGLNPTNGYHPLWMLVCVPVFGLAGQDPILPLRILLVIQGALSAISSIFIYRLIAGALTTPVGILAAAWWAFSPYIHYTIYEFGLETGLAAAMVLALVYALYKFELTWRGGRLSRRRLALLAIMASAVMLSRLDLIFVAILSGSWIILRGTWLRILLPVDLAVAVVAAFAAFIMRLGLPDYYLYTDAAILMASVSVITKVPLYLILGLYESPTPDYFASVLRKVLLAVTASSVLVSAVMLASASSLGGFPRAALLYDWAINLIALVAVRGLARLFSTGATAGNISTLDLIRDRWRGWAKEGLLYYGILLGILALYMLLNKVMIGSASPVSGQIKRWWGEFSSRVYGGPAGQPLSFWGFGYQNDFDAWRPFSFTLQEWSRQVGLWMDSYKPEQFYPGVLVGCGVVVLVVLLINRRMAVRGTTQFALPVLSLGALAQVLSYNITGYAGMKEWYWIAQPVFCVLAGSLVLSILIKPLQKNSALNFMFAIAAIVAGLAMARDFSARVEERMPHGRFASDLPYMDSAQFLEQRTPPGAVIGMTGGGNVGYYIQGRTIVNMDGLINSPAYFAALQVGAASDYLSAIGVDYIFANPTILAGPPYRGQFRTGTPLAQFGGKALMELFP